MNLNKRVNKNTLIKIVIVLLTLFIGYSLYSSGANNIQILEEKKESEIKKNTAIYELSAIQKIFNSYKDFLNKKDISSVINTIGNIAKESGLTISSINPSGQAKSTFYFKYTFDISFSVNDYHSLAKFINNLERSRDIYFIDNLMVNSVMKPKASENAPEPENILNVTLTLSTITL